MFFNDDEGTLMLSAAALCASDGWLLVGIGSAELLVPVSVSVVLPPPKIRLKNPPVHQGPSFAIWHPIYKPSHKVATISITAGYIYHQTICSLRFLRCAHVGVPGL